MQKPTPEIVIGGRQIGRGHAPFIIAEAGINHNGELAKAMDMVRVAKRAGADAIKFQTFKATEFVGDPDQAFTYRSQGKEVTEPMLAMFRRYELAPDAWGAIKAECDEQGITFLSTPQNRTDLDLLLQVGVPAIKVGSDDLTNLPLLKSYVTTKLPLILSCGMADMGEVYRSFQCVGALDGYPTVLLLCTSEYPTPPADVNLKKLTSLQAAFPMIPMGFSDHTVGPMASSLACALGACVFEKHFTLGNDLPGPDHWFSESPDGLSTWVQSIRTAYTMLGSEIVRPTGAELEMRKLARRSITAIRDIQIGERLDVSNIALRRPGTGLTPDLFDSLLGGTVLRNLRAGELLRLGDVRK
jgi:N,N'-diacetyllegionaminate synthase